MSSLFDELSADARRKLRSAAQPDGLEPTLATLVHEPFSHPEWLFEQKFDGQRCLIFRRGDRVELFSRNRKRLDNTYPEIADAVGELTFQDCVLDCEVVASRDGRSNFELLQQRMQQEHVGNDETRIGSGALLSVRRAVPGRSRYQRGAVARAQEALARAATYRDPLRSTPHENADGENYHERACEQGLEGAIAKDARSPYTRGRSRSWLKFKCVANQELVIGGFTEPSGSRPGLGALLVGHYDGPDLVYAGKVGTGFDEDELRRLRTRLDGLGQDRKPFANEVREKGAHWVAPELVANFAFTEWTKDGKLRHPPCATTRIHPK